MQAILAIRGAGRQVLHTADDRVRTEFQGEIAVTGALYGVREIIGKGFTGGAPPKPAQSGQKGVGSEGRQGRRGKLSQDFQDGFSFKSRTETLPSQRVQWQGSDTDSNAGALLAPTRLGHRSDTGGGNPPPPMVTFV